MKKIITALLFCLLSISAFSAETIQATRNANVRILDRIVGLKMTSSKASKLDAKVVELLNGDGFNPTKMVLVLGAGDPTEQNNIFDLDVMMYEVTRVTFTAIDQILINYTQDSFDQDGNTSQVKKSMKIQVLRSSDGSLSGEIKILD